MAFLDVFRSRYDVAHGVAENRLTDAGFGNFSDPDNETRLANMARRLSSTKTKEELVEEKDNYRKRR